MKKIAVLAMVLIMLLSNIIGVSAAGYLPSVSYEAFPGLVIVEDEDGNKIIGYVENANGEVLNTEYHGCILITPVMDAKREVSYLSEEAEKLLVDTYEILSAPDAKLSELIPELNGVAKNHLGEYATADDLVIRELIDITAVCDELIHYLSIDGNTLTLRFKMVVPKEDFITVMTFEDGNWEFAKEVKNNDDGTVTVKFDRLCPVLFLTGLPVEPPAPAQVSLTLLLILCAVILLLIVVVFYLMRRKYK